MLSGLVADAEAALDDARPAIDELDDEDAAGLRADVEAVESSLAAELRRAQDALARADIPRETLDQRLKVTKGSVSVTTMHLAKGLEFRAVAVMACDDEIIPLQERIENVADESDLKEVYAARDASARAAAGTALPAVETAADTVGAAIESETARLETETRDTVRAARHGSAPRPARGEWAAAKHGGRGKRGSDNPG